MLPLFRLRKRSGTLENPPCLCFQRADSSPPTSVVTPTTFPSSTPSPCLHERPVPKHRYATKCPLLTRPNINQRNLTPSPRRAIELSSRLIEATLITFHEARHTPRQHVTSPCPPLPSHNQSPIPSSQSKANIK